MLFAYTVPTLRSSASSTTHLARMPHIFVTLSKCEASSVSKTSSRGLQSQDIHVEGGSPTKRTKPSGCFAALVIHRPQEVAPSASICCIHASTRRLDCTSIAVQGRSTEQIIGRTLISHV